jgi:hypothetical protein
MIVCMHVGGIMMVASMATIMIARGLRGSSSTKNKSTDQCGGKEIRLKGTHPFNEAVKAAVR